MVWCGVVWYEVHRYHGYKDVAQLSIRSPTGGCGAFLELFKEFRVEVENNLQLIKNLLDIFLRYLIRILLILLYYFRFLRLNYCYM